MGSGYLIDSNAIVDFLMFRMPPSGIDFMYLLDPSISVVTRIEIFCKVDIDDEEKKRLNKFISVSKIYQISEEISVGAIDIRINYKNKLPDAIIAATALCYDLTLITRNTKDFEKIVGLKVINPYLL